jgi:hypothetical protein
LPLDVWILDIAGKNVNLSCAESTVVRVRTVKRERRNGEEKEE